MLADLLNRPTRQWRYGVNLRGGASRLQERFYAAIEEAAETKEFIANGKDDSCGLSQIVAVLLTASALNEDLGLPTG